MAVQLHTTVSLSSKGVQNPKLARNASVAVPSPVLRTLTNTKALNSALSTAKTADFVDITFRSRQQTSMIRSRSYNYIPADLLRTILSLTSVSICGRLYTNEDGHLKSVSLPESTIAKSLSEVSSSIPITYHHYPVGPPASIKHCWESIVQYGSDLRTPHPGAQQAVGYRAAPSNSAQRQRCRAVKTAGASHRCKPVLRSLTSSNVLSHILAARNPPALCHGVLMQSFFKLQNHRRGHLGLRLCSGMRACSL